MMEKPEEPLDKNDTRRLAEDMSSTLLGWMKEENNSSSFAREVEQVRVVIDRFPNRKSSSRHKYQWTAAIYVYLKHLARDASRIGCSPREWNIYPQEKPYKGEFLTDFSIWEPGYGLRIACESQCHEGGKNESRVAYALDKLLHVKADIKLLVFEDKHDGGNLLDSLRGKYLTNYLRFHMPEQYLFVQWDHAKVKFYYWCPTDGRHLELLGS